MKNTLLLVLVSILFVKAFPQQSAWRPGEMELKINFSSPEEAKLLGSMQLNTDIYTSYAWAYVVPDEFNRIKEAGLNYEIVQPDLNAWSASFGDALVPQGYYTFNQIKNIADSLVAAYPSICKKVIFGQSASFEELAALKISDNVDVDENEPEILFDGGIHGDEVGGSQNVIMFARDLCRDYGTNQTITDLINNREIWLYYCVNPWGRNNMSRYNVNGVDINRDFGYMWGYEGGSSFPFSQPESKALRSCKLDNQFAVYTNYHSGTEIISYPWSNRVTLAPDKAQFNALAQIYANSSGYTSLAYGQGALVMYLIQGATKDFDYGSLGSVAWSIEISNNKQPAGNLIPYYYDINKPAMIALIEHCGYGIQGTVTDAITGQPVTAAIFEGDNYPSYSDPMVGDFHRYLIPGTYSLKVVANGYEPKIITGVTVSNEQSTTVDVQLQPLAGQYAYRVLTTYIPNFDGYSPGDEGYSAACLMAPDQVSYSLGKGGYIIVDMQDTIYNAEGNDVIVYEGDGSPEGYSLYAGNTMDGPWINLGSGTGTASFDMGTYSVDQARYFKLVDDNNGSANVNDAGFEFDAIASLHPATPDTIGHLSGTLYDGETGFPISGGTIFSGDSVCYSDVNGQFSMDLLRGDNIIWAVAENFGPHCDTLFLAPATITNHDFYLYPNVSSEKHTVETQAYLWPNPVTDVINLNLKLPVSQHLSFKLMNSFGKISAVLNESDLPAGNQRIVLNLNDCGIFLQPGFYTLIIEGPDFYKSLKMIKFK
jgi:hypothetical protein